MYYCIKTKNCKISTFFSLLLNSVIVKMLIIYRKYTIIDNKVKENLKIFISHNIFNCICKDSATDLRLIKDYSSSFEDLERVGR